MNEKEKLQEATLNALTENQVINLDEIAQELWNFDDGEWFIEFYEEYGPFEDRYDFARIITQDEENEAGSIAVKEEYDLNTKDTLEVYAKIYDMLVDLKDNYTESEKKELQDLEKSINNKENLKEAIPYKRIDLVVNKLINTNLELDRDKEKAWDTLKAYDNFKKIAYDFVDVPYNIQQLGVQGMEECYSYLCKLLKVDKLY